MGFGVARNSVTRTIIASLLLYFLAGCSMPWQRASIDSSKVNLQVIIAPQTTAYQQGRAVLVFFTPPYLSSRLAIESTSLFHKAFLRHKVFKIIESRSAPIKEEEEYLMDLAASQGFDVLVQARVADFFQAMGNGETRVGISVKVYNLRTRVTLWYLEGSIREKGEEEMDFLWWKREAQEPSSPYLLLARLAEKIAITMGKTRY